MTGMRPDRWRRVDALLAGALARDPEDRAGWLRSACDDPALLEEVRRILARSGDAARRLGESAVEFAAPLLARGEADLPIGERVGPYRIEEEIGRGGMGVVYRATRADGVYEKTVALKLVKRGMDTDEVLARFRRERRVLAGLDHPGIARLLDGGATDDGRPYLVMERVEGQRITAYCEERELDLDARLALFERVCEAVRHAHLRGVVHRDIKPSNILVQDDGGEPRPKLLDFGIATLLAGDSDETLTRTGAPRLTPEYAAPEQIRGAPVTAATDVYALGVVLHELLVGRRPGPDPRPPSALATTAMAAMAAARGTTPGALRRRLRGDLDTLVLAALQPDPADRYPEVQPLLDDLRRHRHGYPILAARPGWADRAGKFVRRHRAGTIAAAGLALLVTSSAFLYADRVGEEQRVRQEAAERTELMAGVIRELFETADPYALGTRRGDSLLLARGLRKVEEDLAGEPELQVELLATLGRIHRERGRYDQARPVLDRALSIARARHPGPHPSVVAALRERGDLESELMDYGEARRFYGEMLAMQRALYDESDPAIIVTLGLLAQIEALDGRPAEAARMQREVVSLSRRTHSPTDSAHILSLWKLSRALYMSGSYAESESALREVLRLRRLRFGDEHPAVAHAIQWLGLVQTSRGAFDASERHLNQALAMQRRLFGEEHDDVAASLFGLGLLANERGAPERAVERIERSVAMSRRVLGSRHASTLFRLQTLAEVQRLAGDPARSLALLDEVEDGYRRTLGERHERVGATLVIRGRALTDAGELEAAEPVLREALSILGSGAPAGGRVYHEARVAYGDLLTRTGHAARAEPIIRSALGALTTRTAARHDRSVLHARTALAASLAAQGRHDESEEVLREVHDVCRDHYGPDHPRTVGVRRALTGASRPPPPA